MLLDGLFLPVTTPFYLDGRLNLRKLEHNIDRYGKTPAAGFAVLSEHGDPTLLTDEESREALKAAIEIAAPAKVMLAGVSRDSVFATLELSRYAAGLGYDAVLVGVPSVLRGGGSSGPDRLLAYLQAVADQSSLPVVLVSSASDRNGILHVPLVTSLAHHWNVLGMVDGEPDIPSSSQSYAQRLAHIKTATSSVEREVTVTNFFAAVTGRMSAQHDTQAGATFISANTLADGSTALAVAPPKPGLRTRTKTVGFQLLGGSTVDMLEAMRWGADGAMPAFGACAPQGCYEVLAAWKEGDLPLAREKQAKIQQAAEKVEIELGSAGIRYACDLNGYFGGRPRMPLLPVTGEQRAEIEGLMRAIRN